MIAAMTGNGGSQSQQQAFTPTQPKKDTAKEGVNKPLMAFGAALLGSDKNFFGGLGDAGKAYVTTAQEEEAAVRKMAKEQADLELDQLKTALYGKSIEAQMAKASNPWTQRLQELKAQDLENRIKNGSLSKTRDMIYKSIMDDATMNGKSISPDAALKEASRLALSATVASGSDGTEEDSIDVESAIVDYMDYFGQSPTE